MSPAPCDISTVTWGEQSRESDYRALFLCVLRHLHHPASIIRPLGLVSPVTGRLLNYEKSERYLCLCLGITPPFGGVGRSCHAGKSPKSHFSALLSILLQHLSPSKDSWLLPRLSRWRREGRGNRGEGGWSGGSGSATSIAINSAPSSCCLLRDALAPFICVLRRSQPFRYSSPALISSFNILSHPVLLGQLGTKHSALGPSSECPSPLLPSASRLRL